MKPVYQSCMEKGIQHVATHAAEVAVGGSSSTSPIRKSPKNDGRGSKINYNGKLKSS